MTIFEPMTPNAALDRLRSLVADYSQTTDGAANYQHFHDALQTLEQFVNDMLAEQPKPDASALANLIANADWAWRPEDDSWFAYHGIGGYSGGAYNVIEALGWECGSCRPDVGWADWTSIRRTKDGKTTIHVECGHCGADYVYDERGREIEWPYGEPSQDVETQEN